MKEYHKIQTVFLRDQSTKYKTLLENEFALPEFEYLANNNWVFTEKVDGTNIRVKFDWTLVDGEDRLSIHERQIQFGGKTDNASIPAPLIARLQDIFLPKKNVLGEIFPDGVCFYGEGYGAKIGKDGHKYSNAQDFVLFDIRIGDWWLVRQDIEEIADILKLQVVPIVGTGTLYDMVEMAREGFDSMWGNFKAEGIVARPSIELRTRNNRRIITKIKYRDFLRE